MSIGAVGGISEVTHSFKVGGVVLHDRDVHVDPFVDLEVVGVAVDAGAHSGHCDAV